MAAYKRRKRRRSLPLLSVVILTVAALIVAAALQLTGVVNFFAKSESTTAIPPEPTTVVVTDGKALEIHMIDVGQGDSILIKAPDGNLLFDAGKNDSETETALKTYLDGVGVSRLDYVVFTHHDSDHIGSGDMIIKSYEVGTVIMEPYTYSKVTQVYADLEGAIQSKSVPQKDPSPGEIIELGELKMKILGPTKSFNNKNNDSIVARLDYGSTSIMMTGDAEKESEAEILKTYSTAELDCDILKVGHHGSSTSTGDGFLSAVSPDIALISSNPKGNNFGHPKPETITKLNAAGVTIYRTDTLGDIVIITDGNNIQYKQKAG